MWKNSLKNVESDNNKNLYKTLLDFFCSEMVLTFWISLVHINIQEENLLLILLNIWISDKLETLYK